jgi:GNAT superfamily N-acetyltransferase
MSVAPLVRLSPCTDREYAEFVPLQVAEYAQQLIQAGETTAENGLATARQRLADLSADQLRTAGHVFFVATSLDDAARVGWLWVSPAPTFLGPGHERTLWLSQVTVEEPHRRQGWGRAIMVALEDYATDLGMQEIWLRVFDWNVVARNLYESLGYELVTQFATDAHLRKRIAPDRRA